MDSVDELKEIDIKNRTCYYFDDKVGIEVFSLDNISIDEISYKNVLVYNISHFIQNLINIVWPKRGQIITPHPHIKSVITFKRLMVLLVIL